jgi:multiple sugar transport system permease protein
LKNTLVFVLGATLPVWVLSLLAALLFDQAFRGREILKTLFFLPVLPPVVVVAVVWRMLLHPNGVMTWIAGGHQGVTEIPWLASTTLAPIAMIVVHDWAVVPFFMVIWLAGLAGVPKHLREAARIDGASPWQVFWHVDLPQLRSTAVLVAALTSINAFQTFTLQYAMSPDPGGPANSTLVLGLLVLKYGFQYFRMGDAAAVSVVMFAMILAVTAIQLGFNRRVS